MHSREYAAFGHCWVACEGSRECGNLATRAAGTSLEYYGEVEDALGIRAHDSFKQDLANQATGRNLAYTPGTCYSLCDSAYSSGELDLSAPVATCINCSTLDEGDCPAAPATAAAVSAPIGKVDTAPSGDPSDAGAVGSVGSED